MGSTFVFEVMIIIGIISLSTIVILRSGYLMTCLLCVAPLMIIALPSILQTKCKQNHVMCGPDD